MSDAPADTATTEAPEATETPATDAPDFASLADLGLTPEQIKGRLEASRKWEDRAKAAKPAIDELERIKREALPEQERLIAEATAAARAEVLAEVGSARVDDAVKLAAAGRPVDVEALLEGLDRNRFLVDGQPDAAAISAWVDRIAPAPTEQEAPASPWPDLGQGATNSTPLGSDPLLAHLTAMVGPPRG